MDSNEDKIRKLFKDGIITKKEMEAELKKLNTSKQSSHNAKKGWCIVGIAILAAACVITILVLNKPKKVPALDLESGEIVEVAKISEDEPVYEIPQWNITDIKGEPAIETEFHSPKFGILRMAYSPKNGFRFGLYDDNLSPKSVNGMMIGYLLKGEEFAKLMLTPGGEGNCIYYDSPELFKLLDSGDIEALTIEKMNDDCSRDDSVDYRWNIRIKPDELSDMLNAL